MKQSLGGRWPPFLSKMLPLPHIHAAECLISLDKIEKAKLALSNAASRCEEDSSEMEQIKSLHVAIDNRGGTNG